MDKTKYLGKDHRNFKAVGEDYIDLYDLTIGDYFMEDTYPEVYVIVRIEGRYVYVHNLTDDEPDRMFYAEGHSGYGPCCIKLEPRE